jgi:hypothetical protein
VDDAEGAAAYGGIDGGGDDGSGTVAPGALLGRRGPRLVGGSSVSSSGIGLGRSYSTDTTGLTMTAAQAPSSPFKPSARGAHAPLVAAAATAAAAAAGPVYYDPPVLEPAAMMGGPRGLSAPLALDELLAERDAADAVHAALPSLLLGTTGGGPGAALLGAAGVLDDHTLDESAPRLGFGDWDMSLLPGEGGAAGGPPPLTSPRGRLEAPSQDGGGGPLDPLMREVLSISELSLLEPMHGILSDPPPAP